MEQNECSRCVRIGVHDEPEYANIPMDGKSGAFGYGTLTDGGNNLLVSVKHLPIDDSYYEKTLSDIHTHVLGLMEPTAACTGANFEVDLASSGKTKHSRKIILGL